MEGVSAACAVFQSRYPSCWATTSSAWLCVTDTSSVASEVRSARAEALAWSEGRRHAESLSGCAVQPVLALPTKHPWRERTDGKDVPITSLHR